MTWGGAERAGWRAHLPGTGDVDAVVAALGEQTIPALADESARRAGDRLAVVIDGEAITHAELRADAVRLAGRAHRPGRRRRAGRRRRYPLSPYKCPKRVFGLASVPRNDLGKVVRTVLTDGMGPIPES